MFLASPRRDWRAVATLPPASCGPQAVPGAILPQEGIHPQDGPGVVLPLDQRVVRALVGGDRDIAVDADLQIADALGVRLVVLGVFDVRCE